MPATDRPALGLAEGLRLGLPLLALLGLLVPTYHDVAVGLWQKEEHGYAPLLAILSFALIWYRGRAIHLAPEPGFPALGAALLAVGIIGYAVGRSQKIELIELAAGIPLLAGTLTILAGREALKRMRFPLFFLVFSLPYPAWVVDSLTNPLKVWISQTAEWVLYAAGYPIARIGVVLALGPYRLLVEDACSGLHSLIFLSALGLLYIHLTGPRAPWHRLLLIVALLPIAVLANFIRVLALLLITYHFGDAVGQGYWHDLAGVLLFVTAFAALFGLDSLLSLFEAGPRQQGKAGAALPYVEAPLTPARIPSWQTAGMLTVVLLLTGVSAAALTPQQLLADSKRIPDLESLIPSQFGDWRHDEWTDKLLVKPRLKAGALYPHTQMLARTYVNGEGERVMFFISYGSNQIGQEFQEHRPEFCYRAQGFTLLETNNARLSLNTGDLNVRQIVAQQNARLESITYWMTIGDLATLPGVPRKIEQLRYGLQGKIPDGMLVRVSSLSRDKEAAFGLHTRFIADLQQALPGNLGFRPEPHPSTAE